MKVSDLVKRKWAGFANKHQAHSLGQPVNEPRFIIEEARGGVKVVFPSQGNKIYTFLKNNIELINEV